jgi:hypothetical protein
MKTLIIAGVAALGLGAAGGTGFRLATAPPRTPAVQTATVAEGTADAEGEGAVDAAQAPPVTEAATGHDIAPTEVSGAAAEAPAAKVEAMQAAPPPEGKPATEAKSEATDTTKTDEAADANGAEEAGGGPGEFKQLAKILSNMKAADAGRILEHLTDEQVASVFSSMNPRAAALVLAEIPPERGAAVGRILAARAKPSK